MENEFASIRAFAKLVGVSHVTILNAIEAGKITAISPEKKIIIDKAMKEVEDWGIKKAPTIETVKKLIQEYYSEVGTVLAFIAMDETDFDNLLSMADDKEMFFEALDDRLTDYLQERR
jgi:hypothetical protein